MIAHSSGRSIKTAPAAAPTSSGTTAGCPRGATRCTSPPRSARVSRAARIVAVARAHLVLTCGGTTRGPLPAAPRSSFKPWASSRRRRRRPSHLAGRRYLRRHRRHLSRSRRHRCHPCRRRRRRAHRRHLRRVRRLCHHTRQLSAPANRTRRQPHELLLTCLPFLSLR